MCTLVVITRAWADVPLVVAANRDERLDRPAETIRWRNFPGVSRSVLAPRDVEAGGTWLGINQAGLFVGITNRHLGGASAQPGLRSRGELVCRALESETLAAALAACSVIDARRYNAFHLLMASADGRAALAWSDGVAMHVRELPSGLHIATERDPGTASDASMPTQRPAQVRSLVEPILAKSYAGTSDFERVLGHRDPEAPMESPCVCLDDRPYGTRSSMVLVRGADGTGDTLRWVDHAPCSSAFEDRSALLQPPAESTR